VEKSYSKTSQQQNMGVSKAALPTLGEFVGAHDETIIPSALKRVN